MPLSISCMPKPLLRLAGTGWRLPLSSQVSIRRLPRAVFQVMASWPLFCDSAPYFTALVASSCRVIARIEVLAGGNSTSGPLIRIFGPSATLVGIELALDHGFQARA